MSHCCHQRLIDVTLRRARAAGRLCGVLTFDPHPVEVLAPQVHIRYLSTIEQRARWIEHRGVDFLYVVHFTHEVSQLSARDFVRPLVDQFHMRELVIGYDFTLGHKRQGDADYLRALGADWGFSVEVVPPLMVNGEIVSSTRIRKLLAEGRVREALELWGQSPAETGLTATANEGYEEIEHTADVALRVRARSLEKLFCLAARGMFALMTDASGVATASEIALDVTASDRETLLVNWLSELLFQHEMTGQVFREFDLTITPGWQLRGKARGGPSQMEMRKHIKAVTFHDLRIDEHDDVYETTVVFDI